ncbi:alpha/beta hydrolase [Telmatospirillum sp. J64-1]|uniref:alpha/beta hydrolase n=1 Tax=Telmatospirillum sp. J64-1 TaxID=2502183 RepID=UPI00115F5CD5|nr:prolyl oligopeptidase family serine peptidase [Telmatospirillum sp. J64-1]
MSNPALSGPSVPPASGGKPKQLVIFLHGVGSDGNDLIALAPYFAQALPDAEFLSPNAPQPFDMAPFGFQWFSLQDRSPEAIGAGVRQTLPVLNAFIDAELEKRGLTDADLALVGFSQGTMMSLHAALRRPRACAVVVGYSGLLADPESLPGEIKSRPPVLLIHGEADDVVPFGLHPAAVEALERAGVPVLAMTRPGLGHSIDQEGLVAGIRFVAQSFGAARQEQQE